MTHPAKQSDFALLNRVADAINACHGKCALALVSLHNMVSLAKTMDLEAQADLRDIFAASCQSVLRPGDALILAGNGRLILVLDNLIDIHHVHLAGMKLARTFMSPIQLNTHPTELNVFSGIVYLARQISKVHSPTQVLDLAESALHAAIEFDDAQSVGENFHFQVKTLEPADRVDEHWRINQSLDSALKEHAIYLDYQPKIDLNNGELKGAEALIRWRHGGEILSPLSFASALQPELMWNLTQFCFRAVLRDAADCAETLPIALDLDRSCLDAPDLLHFFKREVNFWGIEPQRLLFEISAGTGTLNDAPRRRALFELHQLGFGISIDDVSAGLTSLQQLSAVPAEEIKISGEISGHIEDNPELSRICQEIINYAKQHGIRVVGQNIEDANTLTTLAAWGCKLGQGFYLGAPTTMTRLSTLIKLAS